MNKNDGCDDLNTRTLANTKLLARWTGLWLITLALLSFGPMFLWNFNINVTVPVLILNLLVGARMIWVNKVHLEGLDELHQRIMLEAMALSLGCVLVFGAAFGLLEAVQLISFEPNPSYLLFVLGISYMVGMLLSRKRYL